MRDHQQRFRMRSMCRVLGVHPSGYYAWCQAPLSARARDDRRLSSLVKRYWLERGGVYGYRKGHDDLCAQGETCGKHRVARLMRQAGLKAQVGYGRRPQTRAGRPAVVAANRLQQQFDVRAPNKAWVTDITSIRTHEGWLYVAVVIDRFSRQVVGWSMPSSIDRELVLRALLMAVWHRKPAQSVVVHADQGSQYTRHDWQACLQHHNLLASMSRRGNCHHNAVAESCFQ